MAVGLTINGQSFDLDGFAEHTTSLARLWGAVTTRGENRTIPGAEGRKALAPIVDEVTIDMELDVFGVNDNTGTPHANETVGVSDNVLWLRDFVAALADGSTDTVTASLEVLGSRTFGAEVQILNFQVVNLGTSVARVLYDLRIPGGTWTETTPP